MMAGEYKDPIKLYKVEEEVNEYGERVPVEKYVMATRSKVDFSSGNRTTENSEIVYNYSKTFYVRAYVPVSDTSIIEFDGKRYRVITVDHRREYNDIRVVTEQVNE